MSDTKVTEFPATTSPVAADVLPIVTSISVSPVNSKIVLSDLLLNIAVTDAENTAGVTPVDLRYEPGNVLRYGTNTTPGTTDMNAAFASMALVGGECSVPDGTYIITGVTFATAISITLSDAAIIKQASSNNVTMLTVSTDDFSISGGAIDFDRANNTTEVFTVDIDQNGSTGHDDITFDGVHFKNCAADTIRFKGGKRFKTMNCKFTNCARGATSLICQDGGADISYPEIINNWCDFTGIQQNDGAWKNRGSADGNSKIVGLRFIGNLTINDAGSTSAPMVGLDHARSIERSVITDNIFIGGLIGISSGSFVTLDSASTGGPVGCVIANNTCYDQKLEGIEVAMNSRDTIVANNTIDGNANCLRGILSSGLGANSTIRTLIEGNTIRNLNTTASSCISVGQGADEVQIIGNYLNAEGVVEAIRMTGVSKNNVIRGNTIDCDGAVSNSAIKLDNCAGVDIGGNTINDAQVYCVALLDDSADTFVDGNVTTGTDRITLTAHFHANADEVTLTTTGTLPAGLALATTYYVRSIDVDTIELYSDSGLTSIVDITAAAGGGTHKILRTIKNLNITNNEAFNFGTAFFANTDTAPYGTGVRIQNNTNAGVQTFTSADATPSVLIGSNFLSNATGVTITQFDDGYAGQEIVIISGGATVYDTSTATRLIGSSVDITTAAGDITTWVCHTGGTSSSVWRLKGFVDISVDNSAGA